MNNLRNDLFIKFAAVVLIIIALFEGALIFALTKSFNMHLKDRLVIIASEIANSKKYNINNLIELQHKYKIYPLFVKITTLSKSAENLKKYEGFEVKTIKTPSGIEKMLIFNYVKNNKIISVKTIISGNSDKIEIVRTISLAISFFIYLIVLLVGYKFIDAIAKNIENTIKRLKFFNSNVSHELKTPLTIMKGEIELALKKEECSEKLLKSILNEINYINDITEKLLFLTKKDFTKKDFKQTDLEDIILELYEKYSKRIAINLEISEDDFLINGDKTLLKMAISNLIENSIKYHAKHINLKLKKTKNKIKLIIEDDGIGIPKEKIPFIFDEFYRVDESRNKKIKGFGLGLAIVKSILNLHSAKINVESDINKGVKITIEFNSI
ncbi:cell wall metabolism sensor histidine kinase WalK [Lebetimonas sp. JH292]|uniref:sensor histidine kinase n=1 Tax=Lebetimonas sp. JH292 TaxID=990068 RepID=UPI000462F555|nr:HAMP domain-containing sensor histidine kinase [Lebetimonas sp. JH292]